MSTADLQSRGGISQIVNREFDCVTPENAMKWDAVESARGQYNFREGDILVNNAQQHGQKVRGHTLVWHSQLPHWVSNGHFSAAELRTIMQNHINATAGHFRGKIYAWDVVNEIFNEDGTLRQSVFSSTLGKSFVADAFRYTHAVDPSAKLYINDYNVEGINAKSTAMYNLVKELLASGVPINGVGFQTHLSLGQMHQDLQRNIERFAALGLDVALTEVDIAVHLPVDASKLAQQARDYESVFRACLAVPRCVGVTVWGISDRYSWIIQFSQGNGAPLLFDDNNREKPAYTAVKNLLSGHH